MSFNVTELLNEYLQLENEARLLPDQHAAATERLKQYVNRHQTDGDGLHADNASEALQIWQEAIRLQEKMDAKNEQMERVSSQIINVFNILNVNKLSTVYNGFGTAERAGKVTFENNNGTITHD